MNPLQDTEALVAARRQQGQDEREGAFNPDGTLRIAGIEQERAAHEARIREMFGNWNANVNPGGGAVPAADPALDALRRERDAAQERQQELNEDAARARSTAWMNARLRNRNLANAPGPDQILSQASVSGTFNAAAIRGMFGGETSAQDRLEQIAQSQQRTLDQILEAIRAQQGFGFA